MTYQGCTDIFVKKGAGQGRREGGGGGGGGAQINLCDWQLLQLASKRETRFR